MTGTRSNYRCEIWHFDCFMIRATHNVSFNFPQIELPDMYTSLYTLPDGGDSVSEKFGYAVLIQGRSYVPPELITKPMYWQLNLDEMDSDMVQLLLCVEIFTPAFHVGEILKKN